jgi:Cu-Zn family superoxide dismutase
MKKITFIIALTGFVFITSCKNDNKTKNTETEEITIQEADSNEETEEGELVFFKLEAKSKSNVTGNITFKEHDNKVTMIAVINGLNEGEHAIHIHESSDCSSDDGKSSGGHWNPTAQPHGQWGSENGYHKGDIGNFTANAEGKGSISVTTDEWCIGCGDDTKDILGKAIIVHEGVDDLESQPSGAAGARVSCGGIIQ